MHFELLTLKDGVPTETPPYELLTDVFDQLVTQLAENDKELLDRDELFMCSYLAIVGQPLELAPLVAYLVTRELLRRRGAAEQMEVVE